MSSADHDHRGADLGLLAPAWAGTPAEEATGDAAFLQAMLDAETALSRALGAPEEVSARLRGAARAGRFDVRDLALRARAGGNPVIPLVADLRAGLDDEAAGWVHRGATSQDILDTTVMLVASRTRPLILADLDAAADHLAVLAAAHRDTAMPGRTLTQHAVPTTFGLKAAGWRSLVLDARDRLAALRLPAQLGGAAGTLAALGADPDLPARYARAVGLDAPDLPWHVLRTPVADLGGALALTGGALAKIAADVLLLARTETAELSEGRGGASSAMPHKSNPVHATLAAAAARPLPALAATLFASMAAEDERPAGAWHAEWQALREALRLAGGAGHHTAAATAGLQVHADRMRADLDLTAGLISSERLLAALAPRLGAGPARDLLATAARHAGGTGLPLADVLAGRPELNGVLTADALRELLDPTGYLGAAPALTDRALRRTGRTSRTPRTRTP
ncbi:putative 3-carboxymuconate cycloisomerase [Actinacidiphila reveromycinica]|uniref:Putative 3-carboxymuconate cycloisomerase n=1 Tax=Actinacidiphila reveromycinica TaxID=659352 RepID=A0A7U3UPM8_9ACTN|nr:3-carboxy-cis,cis-muconate cycloisomerase [Streptomyces sp. SN-593]BBA96408.1 putative 3-carboxymuconate cycloisomerase [Streptomyces sp. SN-593]